MSTTYALILDIASSGQNLALKFSHALRFWGVPFENIHLFSEEQANRERLLSNLLLLKQQTAPFHFLLLYVGHEHCAFPNPSSSLLLYQSSIALDEMIQKIGELNALTITLFFDACFLRINTLINPSWQKAFSHKSFFCLASTGMSFTQSLLKALSIVRNDKNTPEQLLEEMARDFVNKPLPEMYNIETYRFQFFPKLESSRSIFLAQLGDLFVQNLNEASSLTFEEAQELIPPGFVLSSWRFIFYLLRQNKWSQVLTILNIKRFKKAALLAIPLLCLLLFAFFKPKQGPDILLAPSPYMHFVGREETFKTLNDDFFSQNRDCLVLCGQGGMGKTETAIQFAHRNKNKFSFIYWMNAGSQEVYEQSYWELAQYLKIPVCQDMLFEKIREKVHVALESRPSAKPWLLIFDNADQFLTLPARNNGKVLITARDKMQWSDFLCIEMTPFSEKNADQLFRRILSDSTERPEWQKLAKEMEYLPLALDQALHCVKESPTITLAQYCNLLNEGTDILDVTASHQRYGVPLASIWKIVRGNLEKKDPQAVEWLNICAYLHPDKIPIEWVALWLQNQKGISHSEAILRSHAIMSTLSRSGLISVNKKKGTFSIHRLKQKLLQKSHPKPDDAVKCLAQLVQACELSEDWQIDPAFLLLWEANAVWLAEQYKPLYGNKRDLVTIFHVLGNINMAVKKKYKKAMEFYKFAEIELQSIDDENGCVLNFLNQGWCLYKSGYYEQAEENFLQALSLSRPPSMLYMDSLYSLAYILYYCHQKYDIAIQYCEKGLNILKDLDGPDAEKRESEFKKIMSYIFSRQEDDDKSLTLSLEALELNKRAYSNKPNINCCYILNQISSLYCKMNNPVALNYALQALQMEEKIFSKEFPPNIGFLDNVAHAYRLKKDYDNAFIYLNRALNVIKEIYSDKLNVLCLITYNQMGFCYLDIKEYDKALEFFSLTISNAPQVITNSQGLLYAQTYEGLGCTYLAMGQKELGKSYLEKALSCSQSTSKRKEILDLLETIK